MSGVATVDDISDSEDSDRTKFVKDTRCKKKLSAKPFTLPKSSMTLRPMIPIVPRFKQGTATTPRPTSQIPATPPVTTSIAALVATESKARPRLLAS